MPDVVNNTASDSNDVPVAPAGAKVAAANQTTAAPNPIQTESHEEKLRKAKIAMEGFERTVNREANEKQDEANKKKGDLNQLLLTINHEKELLELTWVNLDDKRTSLKNILEPILTKEDQLQNEEIQEESQEEVTVVPKEKRLAEEKRWQTQTQRRQKEEEKWLVEEKITKIEEQIDQVKVKYQEFLNQEEDVRKKIQEIDEQVLIQQEVLRQQNELREQQAKQEALKKLEEEQRKVEEEKRRMEEMQKAEEERKKLEAESQELQAKQKALAEAKAAERIEQLRKAEEERQKQETAKWQVEQEQLAKIEELKSKLAAQQTPAPVPEPTNNIVPPQPKPETMAQTMEPATPAAAPEPVIDPKQEAIRRLAELERIRRENEEAEKARSQSTSASQDSFIDKLKGDEGIIKPLRTLKSDLDAAVKSQQVNDADLKQADKKTYPWLNQ